MPKKKILVYAYAVSPTKGSEYSVAWNYITEMSKDNELVVIYGVSGEHLGDTDELESYINNKPLPNAMFIAIKPNLLARCLNTPNRYGVFVYSFYLAYQVWQKQVYSVVKDLIDKEKFDLIHYLGPIGYRAPGYLWKFDLPYMWGPIGGTNNIPFKLLKVLPLAGIFKLGFRNLANTIQLYSNTLVRKAINRADLILTATTSVQKDIKTVFNIESIYYPENSIKELYVRNEDKFNYNKLKLIWIGRIDANKALNILLKSLTLLKDKSLIELNVVGDGPLLKYLKSYAEEKHISNCIIWHGSIQRKQVFNLINNSHIHIITSVSEGNPTTIWEAMSLGVPTLSLDHCGMHDTICDKCGIKIPINSLNQIISDIAYEIGSLSLDHNRLKKLSDGVLMCAKNNTWAIRKSFFEQMYDQTIFNWTQKRLKHIDE